jgi:hypothetical protein
MRRPRMNRLYLDSEEVIGGEILRAGIQFSRISTTLKMKIRESVLDK